MQFNQAADLARYPRPLEADLALCERAGVDLVWAPDVETVYRGRPGRGVGDRRCRWPTSWRARTGPGHFDGMLTVVAKLLNQRRARIGRTSARRTTSS